MRWIAALLLIAWLVGAVPGGIMTGSYRVVLYTDTGTLVETLPNFVSLDYSILTGDIGVCTIVMPHTWATTNVLTAGVVNVDYKIVIYRTPPGGTEQLENVYLLREVRLYSNEQGDFTELTGVDGNQLLARRYISLWDTSSTAPELKTGPADNVMKALVKEAMTDAADFDERWIPPITGGSTYFAVVADTSAGPSITDNFSYRMLLECVQSIAKAALAAGTPIYWNVVSTTPVKFTFTTYAGQIGTDRTGTITASIAAGNMKNPSWSYNAVDEKTEVTALGGNYGLTNKDVRHVVIAKDASRIAQSVYGRVEGTVEAYGTDDTTTKLKDRAKKTLSELNAKRTITFDFVESVGCRYGLHWFFGDKIAYSYRGLTGTAIIKSVVVSFDSAGEKISAGLDISTPNTPA
jgi:hypothetical protein